MRMPPDERPAAGCRERLAANPFSTTRETAPVRNDRAAMLALSVLLAASAAAIAHAPPAAHAQDSGGAGGAGATIQGLVDGAEAGATVVVAPGTYANESVTIDKPLTLAPGAPGAVILTGNSSIAVLQGPGGPVSVSGLVFRDIACPAGGPGGSAVVAVGGPRPDAAAGGPAGMVAIRNNTFDRTCASAVSVDASAAAAPASDVAVSGNTFRGIGAAAPANATAPPAVRLGMPSPAPSGAQVADSLVSSNHMFGLRGAAVQASGAQGVTILGNHIEGAGSSAILVASNSSGVRIVGNTVIGAAAPAFAVWADSPGVLIMGNRVSESAGVLSVCAGQCEAGGGGAGIDVRQPDLVAGAAAPVRFHHNTVHESNTGALVENGGRQGTVDARANYYPGYDPAPSRLAGDPSATAMPGGSAPMRIGALLAATDLPFSDGIEYDAAVLEAAVRFNLAQAESGGNASVEIVRADLRLGDPLAAVSALAEGRDDARNFPVLSNQIESMRAAVDGQGRDAAVRAVLALESPQEHYPFIVNRTGHVLANGANPDRAGVLSPIASPDNPVPFAGLLEALDAAPAGSAMWYDYRISNFVHEGQPVESKRSLLSVHDLGTADKSDDLVLGAGYYPRPVSFSVGPSVSISVAEVREYAGEAGLVLVSPASIAPSLAAQDTVYRMAPADGLRAPRFAEVMADGGARDVVAIVQDDVYGNTAYEQIRAEFAALSRGSVLPKVPFNTSIGAGQWGPAMERANAMLLAADAAGQGGGGTAVLYIGLDRTYIGAVAEASKHPALAGARWYSNLVGSEAVIHPEAARVPPLSQGLRAIAFGVEKGPATAGVDAAVAARPGGGSAADPRTGYVYAAHDAVLLIGAALAAGHDTPGKFASSLHGLAAAGLPGGGALGDIAFDGNGDLILPATFSTWEITSETGRWLVTETSEQDLSCSVSLASTRLDLGSAGPGQAGEARRQVVTNSGTAALTGISLGATEWSGGLPAGATSFAAVPEGGGAAPAARFAPLSQGASLLGGNGGELAPGTSVSVDYRLDLTGIAALPAGVSPGAMEQTITYAATCG